MEIKTIQRPWQPKTTQRRYNKDSFYQSSTWKDTKTAFIRGSTITPSGYPLLNIYCYDCFVETGKLVPKHTIDHHIPIKQGGDRTAHSNLRSLCEHHHAIKSAKEGNERRKG